MGLLTSLLSLIFKTTVYTIGVLAFLIYAPFLLELDPVSYDIKLPKFEGPLAVNSKLSQSEHLFVGQFHGPESVTEFNGDLYSGVTDGRIIRVRKDKVSTLASVTPNPSKCVGFWQVDKCGRLLGTRVDSKGDLYVLDAYYGIKKVDLKANQKQSPTTVFDPKVNLVEGLNATVFLDDLVIKEGAGSKGGHVYYMTEGSAKWPLDMVAYSFLEFEDSGRVLKFDADTKQTTVVKSGIGFPNGIELTDNGNALLIAEFNRRRILKHHIAGPKSGSTEVLIANLPGEPDNIRRSGDKLKETYWIAFFAARQQGQPSFIDVLSDKPYLRKALLRAMHLIGSGLEYIGLSTSYEPLKDIASGFKTGRLLFNLFPLGHGLVIEIDAKGRILNSLHSPDGHTTALSEVHEVESGSKCERVLYLGSYMNNYLGKLVLRK